MIFYLLMLRTVFVGRTLNLHISADEQMYTGTISDSLSVVGSLFSFVVALRVCRFHMEFSSSSCCVVFPQIAVIGRISWQKVIISTVESKIITILGELSTATYVGTLSFETGDIDEGQTDYYLPDDKGFRWGIRLLRASNPHRCVGWLVCIAGRMFDPILVIWIRSGKCTTCRKERMVRHRRALAWGRRHGIPKGSDTHGWSWKELENWGWYRRCKGPDSLIGTSMVMLTTISSKRLRGASRKRPRT